MRDQEAAERLGRSERSAAGSVRAAVSALPLKRSRISYKSGGSCLGADLRMLAEPRESCDIEQLAGRPIRH
jgi:hypothetical protein